MTQSKPKVEVRVDSCGAAAIVYLPDGRRMSARQAAERMLELEVLITRTKILEGFNEEVERWATDILRMKQ